MYDSLEGLAFEMRHMIARTSIGSNLRVVICNSYDDSVNDTLGCMKNIDLMLAQLKTVIEVSYLFFLLLKASFL